jgi:hypothetical protein
VQAREPKTPFGGARSSIVPVGPASACEIARFHIDPKNMIRAVSISMPHALPPELRARHAGAGLPLSVLPAPLPGSEPLQAMVRECRNTGRPTYLTWESAVRAGEMRGARAWPAKSAGWVWLAVDHFIDVAVRQAPRADSTDEDVAAAYLAGISDAG